MDEANMSNHKALICTIKYSINTNMIPTRLNHMETSMDHGNYVVTVTQTTQDVMTFRKARHETLF